MVPDADDCFWARTLTRDDDLDAASLATRLLIARLRREIRADPGALEGRAAQLRDLAVRSPGLRHDLVALAQGPRRGGALVTVDEASEILAAGTPALVAGSETALRRLPRGRWIGGVAVHFVTARGGVVDRRSVFLTTFPEAASARALWLPGERLSDFALTRAARGFTAIVIPAFSAAHVAFAVGAGEFPHVFDQPLVGWIAGGEIDGGPPPQVVDGATGEAYEDGAVLLHVEIPPGLHASLDIVNLFRPADAPGGRFAFPETGLEVTEALADGVPVNFARYFVERGFDRRLPLVANYAGAAINVSIRALDPVSGVTRFYAPVVAGETYRLAEPLPDYGAALTAAMPDLRGDAFACNCILNWFYGKLEGRPVAGGLGPATFGEIAYMLLNQTMVRLRLTA